MNNWQPTTSINNLKKRAEILARIRQFFAERNVLEVETPALSHATVTDPYLHSFKTKFQNETLYLQTSPEYAMKRLLVAGSGPIFQICKSFRDDESGRYHNPEFTMLEWYRPDFDHHDLMREMDELLQLILQTKPAEKFSYAEIFANHVGVNPHTATIDELKTLVNINENERDILLQLIMSEIIEPKIGQEKPTFIFDYPITQAALAKIRNDNPPVAERFEVYFKGIELANGFHELQDAAEQKKRFEKDLAKRKKLGYETVNVDIRFLQALEQGLPECAGVALGIDRLVMLALGENHIEKTIAFPVILA
jgi:elongation factor P--(R)-beta-lysine ligase